MKKNKIILFLLTLAFIFFSLPALAQENNTSTAPVGFLDRAQMTTTCLVNGDCQLNDIVLALTALINFMLGVVGALALLYFFWGGITWLTSSGRPERVKKGTSIMTNTVIALLIVFGSYVLLRFLVNDVLQVDTQYQIQSGDQGNIEPSPPPPNQP